MYEVFVGYLSVELSLSRRNIQNCIEQQMLIIYKTENKQRINQRLIAELFNNMNFTSKQHFKTIK